VIRNCVILLLSFLIAFYAVTLVQAILW